MVNGLRRAKREVARALVRSEESSMTTIDDKVRDEALVEDAYERVKADLAAVPQDQLVRINTDVHAATRAILGALPALRAMRPRIAAMPEFDLEAFDKLEDYVWAMRYAQATYQIATRPPDDLEELTSEGNRLRERMIADVGALQAFGWLGKNVLENLQGGNGYNNLAVDLDILCRLMTSEWPQIADDAHTTAEELKQGYRIGARLTRVAGLREQGPARLAEAMELRTRAFTVLLGIYEQTRAAISYLRYRQRDVDSIAPSLYPGKARRRAANDEVVAEPLPAAAVSEVLSAPAPAPTPALHLVENGGPFLR
jgi:hypothetical protein